MEFLLDTLAATLGFLIATTILTGYAVFRARRYRRDAEAKLREFEAKVEAGEIDLEKMFGPQGQA